MYRDWCRACVGGTRQSDAHKRRHEEQNSLLVASMDYGVFTDGDDGEHEGSYSVSGGESLGEEHTCSMQKVWRTRQQSRKRSSRSTDLATRS